MYASHQFPAEGGKRASEMSSGATRVRGEVGRRPGVSLRTTRRWGKDPNKIDGVPDCPSTTGSQKERVQSRRHSPRRVFQFVQHSFPMRCSPPSPFESNERDCAATQSRRVLSSSPFLPGVDRTSDYSGLRLQWCYATVARRLAIDKQPSLLPYSNSNTGMVSH
jgi:hypothetical protein